MRVEQTWCLTKEKDRAVPLGHDDADSILIGVGGTIEDAEARRLGIIRVPKPPEPPAPTPPVPAAAPAVAAAPAYCRVLHVVPYCIAGGVESWMRLLARHQPGVDHHCWAAYYLPEGLAMYAGGPVTIHHPNQPLQPDSPEAAAALTKFLEQHPEYNILHAAYHGRLYGPVRADGRPVVVTVHGAGYGWLDKCQPPDAIAVVGRHLQTADRHVIMNGVDLTAMRYPAGWYNLRQDHGIPAEAFVVLWVNRIHPTKGLGEFETAAARILEHPSCWVVAVGHGKDADQEVSMAALARHSRMVWERFVAPGDMPDVYAGADVLLHTSPYEGFGLVVAEAQAAGRPVVAFNVPGVNEIVADGKTGVLVSAGDAEALAEAVLAFAGDRKRAHGMGTAGQARAAERFGAARMGQEYAQLYRQVLKADAAPVKCKPAGVVLYRETVRLKQAVAPTVKRKPAGVVLYSGQEWSVFGGGQATTQVARAFARRGFEVLFVPLTLSPQRGGNTGPPLPDGVRQVGVAESTGLVREFIASHRALWWCGLPGQVALEHLREWAGRVPTIYQIRDNWAAFKERWWNAETERQVAAGVDVLTAITPQYADRFGRECHTVPNAHDPSLWHFRPRPKTGRPPTVIYWGSYGKLFWRDDVFRAVARSLPRWRFALIGGYTDYLPTDGLPDNVDLVGWQPLSALCAYANGADLGFIPFGTRVSQMCDPIKAHEYVAAGLPFVACGCPSVELHSIPEAIHTEPEPDAVVKALRALARQAHDVEAQRSYVAGDTWDARVARWLELVGWTD